MQESQLHIHGQAGGHALHIDLVSMVALRLQEQLMPLLIRETYQLCLDGRAIARSYPLYQSVCHRGTVDIVHNDLVGSCIGIGQIAWHLLTGCHIAHKGKIPCLLIPRLDFHFAIIQ